VDSPQAHHTGSGSLHLPNSTQDSQLCSRPITEPSTSLVLYRHLHCFPEDSALQLLLAATARSDMTLLVAKEVVVLVLVVQECSKDYL